MINNRFHGTNLLDIEKEKKVYDILLEVVEYILIQHRLDSLLYQGNKINDAFKNLSNVPMLMKEGELFDFIEKVKDISKRIEGQLDSEMIVEKKSSDSYVDYMKQHQFGMFESQNVPYHYKKKEMRFVSTKSIKRVASEISSLSSNLPISECSTVFIKIDDTCMNCMKALIIGPEDTPYDCGAFIFDIYLPPSYPNEPPLFNIQTTGYGKVRFNPNLYNCGKVCLSILGTWSGQQGEKWNASTSTLLQVLVSIQSLILVENPYFNEPGYERDMHTETGKQRSRSYNEPLEYHTLQYAILDHLENPCEPFASIIKEHIGRRLERINTIGKKYMEHSKYCNNIKDALIKINSHFTSNTLAQK